jgi:hypothetical protein
VNLESAILAATKTPATYDEILAAVGEQEGFALGIALSRMVVAGTLHYKESKPFSKSIPVYCAEKIPAKFKMTPRNPNAKQEKGEDDED